MTVNLDPNMGWKVGAAYLAFATFMSLWGTLAILCLTHNHDMTLRDLFHKSTRLYQRARRYLRMLKCILECDRQMHSSNWRSAILSHRKAWEMSSLRHHLARARLKRLIRQALIANLIRAQESKQPISPTQFLNRTDRSGSISPA